jgi:hypothetical protein
LLRPLAALDQEQKPGLCGGAPRGRGGLGPVTRNPRIDLRPARGMIRPNTTIDDVDTQAEQIRTWLVQALLKMKVAFGPLLKTVG